MNDGSLDIQDLTVRFGGLTALDDVTLMAVPKQVTGIIGPNGAGKTPRLNAVGGSFRPEAGRGRFDGKGLTRIRPHRRARPGIARTLQGVGLFGGLSVLENVMVGATRHARTGFWSALSGLPLSDRDERRLRERGLAALDRVGAADLADRMPPTLAHGPPKRGPLARALACEPRLLLLDEPASGLSDDELSELGHLIGRPGADLGVLRVGHRMDLMMSVCDRIFVLDFGKLIADGTPRQGQENPVGTQAYLVTPGSDTDDQPVASNP